MVYYNPYVTNQGFFIAHLNFDYFHTLSYFHIISVLQPSYTWSSHNPTIQSLRLAGSWWLSPATPTGQGQHATKTTAKAAPKFTATCSLNACCPQEFVSEMLRSCSFLLWHLLVTQWVFMQWQNGRIRISYPHGLKTMSRWNRLKTLVNNQRIS